MRTCFLVLVIAIIVYAVSTMPAIVILDDG
jgi:hypothetical protein